MNEEDSSEQAEQELDWSGKVLQLNQALSSQGLPYAFGGAIALNYHREPRSTLDIDVNIFLAPDSQADVLTVLSGLYELGNRQCLEREIEEQGQTRSRWRGTYVDLFFANTDFHRSMAQRVEHQPFGDATIPVLSVEDLIVCKVLYDRPKDWVDIALVVQTEQDKIDGSYIRHWVGEFLPAEEPRVQRVERLFPAAS